MTTFIILQNICTPNTPFWCNCRTGSSITDIPILQDELAKLPSIPKTGYARLKPFLCQQRRVPDRVLGDGNCLFQILSRSLTWVEDHHLELRKTTAKFKAGNPVALKGLHNATNRTPLTGHLNSIKKPFVWNATLEIIAALSQFQFDVYRATWQAFPHG